MRTRALSVAAALSLGLLTWSGTARPQPAPGTAATGGGRDTAHYTADRPLDFVHMRLELTFTPEGLQSKTCEGRVEYTLKPRSATAHTVRLDAVDMRVLAVEVPGEDKPPAFSYDDKVLTVQLPRPVGPAEEFKLAVKYRLADPPLGMHFVLPTASQPKRPLMVYTMSEPLEARYWFPTHDWPNARWTSDIVVTVPAPYTVVANGALREKKPAADGNAVTFHWHNEVPTDPHLIGLALGELVELRDTWRGKPLRVYTQRGLEAAAKHTFRRVPEMLEFFTKLTGVDFPYPGYNHVTVVDHHHGGMEHAGFSFVDPRFLAAGEDGEWPLEFTEKNLLAHMLAHQWFGGIVNYRSVSEAWLNEGFAVLLDSLWTGHTDAPDRFECQMWETARRVARFDPSETGKPMVYRHFTDPEEVFRFDGGKVYSKGAWVLQMLRHQLGEAVFWRAVAKYLNDHRFKSVETSDLRRALEEASGRDLEQFFQQWVYGRGVPRLEVEYAWDLTRKRARVTVRQTQKIDKETPAFLFPLDLHFRVDDENKDVTVNVTEARHEFTFDFASEPSVVSVDPRGGLLKTLVLKVPRAMLIRQAESGPTALSRLMAVEELSKQAHPEAVAALEQALKKGSEFWKVRSAAAEGLGKMQTEPALRALVRAEKEGLAQPRALAGLLQGLGGYTVSREAHVAVLKYTQGQKSLDVETAAISALARMRASPELVEKSLEVLQAAAQKPTRRAVRGAAFRALTALDDPRTFATVLKLAQPGQSDELRGQIIRILGRLGRHDGLRDRARTALTAWLDDPDRSAQEAAAFALGALGDPRAIADLERVRGSARAEGVRRFAAAAIQAIRRPEDPKQAPAALMERLAAIEKRNQELERQVKELSGRLDALKKAPEKKTDKPQGKE